MRVLERLHRHVATRDTIRLARLSYEQAIGVFVERQADDGAHQLHPRALHGSVVERVAEHDGVTRLLGDF